jgi:hypothetical protein
MDPKRLVGAGSAVTRGGAMDDLIVRLSPIVGQLLQFSRDVSLAPGHNARALACARRLNQTLAGTLRVRAERSAPNYINALDEIAAVDAALETAAENPNEIEAALTRAEALLTVLRTLPNARSECV